MIERLPWIVIPSLGFGFAMEGVDVLANDEGFSVIEALGISAAFGILFLVVRAGLERWERRRERGSRLGRPNDGGDSS
jgi:hypothetical protein